MDEERRATRANNILNAIYLHPGNVDTGRAEHYTWKGPRPVTGWRLAFIRAIHGNDEQGAPNLEDDHTWAFAVAALQSIVVDFEQGDFHDPEYQAEQHTDELPDRDLWKWFASHSTRPQYVNDEISERFGVGDDEGTIHRFVRGGMRREYMEVAERVLTYLRDEKEETA